MEGIETAKPKLLVIDDDPGILETFTDLFVERGYSVDTAGAGKSAIKKSRKTAYDVALIDIRLPDIGGIDLLKKLKKGRPDMACIIITGNATMQNAIDALGDGANGYFVKPLVIREVIQRIDEAVEKRRLQRKLSESLQRYQGLVETSADAIISANSAGKIIQWNDAASRIFGYSQEEITGRKLDILIPEKDKKRHKEALTKYAKSGKSRLVGRAVEREGLHKDGSIIPVELSISASKEIEQRVFTAIIRDVTERRKADEKLRENEEKYRMVVENINEIVYLIDVTKDDPFSGDARFISPGSKHIIGYEAHEFLEDKNLWFSLIHTEDVPVLMESTRKIIASKEAGIREYRVLDKRTGEYRWLEDVVIPQLDDLGNVVGIFGVARDITGRKRAEIAITKSEVLYHGLVETSQDLIWRCDEKGRFTFLNHAWTKTHGYEIKEMMGRPFSDFQTPEVAARDMQEFKRHMKGGTITGYETTQISKAGDEIHLVFKAMPIYDTSGSIMGTQGTAYDITERKRVEEALKESESRWRAISENSPAHVMLLDKDLKIRFINRTVPDLTIEEVIGKSILNFVPPGYDKIAIDSSEQVLKTGKPATYITQYKTKEGEIRYFEVWVGPVLEEDRVVALVSSSLDITERKIAEDALKESEGKFRTLATMSPSAVYLTDKDGKCVYANKKWREMTGQTLEEALGGGWKDGLHPDDKEKVFSDWEKTVQSKGAWGSEYRFQDKKGNVTWVYGTAAPITGENGNILGYVGNNSDITERKRTEEALRFTQFAVDRMGEAAFWMDSSGLFIYVNEAACKLLGYSDSELLKMTVYDISSEINKESWTKRWNNLKKIRTITREFMHRRKDGRLIPVEVTANHVVFDGKEFNCSFVRDITVRKEAEEALRYSSKKYQDLVDNALVGVYKTNLKGEIHYVNEALLAMFEYKSPEELKKGGAIPTYKNRKDRNILIEKLRKTGKVDNFELELLTKTKKTRNVLLSATLDGDVLSGMIMDITERKKAEESMKESERKYRELFENVKDGIAIVDTKGNIVISNSEFARMFGYTEKEFRGKSSIDFIHPKDKKRVIDIQKKRFSGGKVPSVYEFLGIKKDGEHIDIEIKVATIEEGGRITGSTAILRDITERKKAEEDMLRKFLRFNVKRGEIYLIKEKKPDLSIEVFKDMLSCGFSGTVFSRATKEDIEKSIGNVRSFWFAESSRAKDAIDPKFSEIQSRIDAISGGNNAVLIDRIDYLILKNGFTDTLKFVQRLFEQAYHQKLIVILVLDSSTLRPREIRLLEKETKRVEPKVKSKIPHDIYEILKFVYSENRIGEYPSFKDVHEKFKITRTTARNRIKRLRAMELLVDKKRGRTKVLEITEKGREQF